MIWSPVPCVLNVASDVLHPSLPICVPVVLDETEHGLIVNVLSFTQILCEYQVTLVTIQNKDQLVCVIMCVSTVHRVWVIAHGG